MMAVARVELLGDFVDARQLLPDLGGEIVEDGCDGKLPSILTTRRGQCSTESRCGAIGAIGPRNHHAMDSIGCAPVPEHSSDCLGCPDLFAGPDGRRSSTPPWQPDFASMLGEDGEGRGRGSLSKHEHARLEKENQMMAQCLAHQNVLLQHQALVMMQYQHYQHVMVPGTPYTATCLPPAAMPSVPGMTAPFMTADAWSGTYSAAQVPVRPTPAYVAPSPEAQAVRTNAVEKPLQTTIMVRNIPNNYTRAMFLKLLDEHVGSLEGIYDFVYLPVDFTSHAGLGYAFVNFTTVKAADEFRRRFHGFSNWAVPSDKVCDVRFSGATQGLEANVERYRNSHIMHESVLDEFKPALFVNGVQVVFPPPTKMLRAPQLRSTP